VYINTYTDTHGRSGFCFFAAAGIQDRIKR